MEGIIEALCKSEKKGTAKQCVPKVELKENYGILGDAHAGNWHRQISLLSLEKVDAFRVKGAEVQAGSFGENILLSGLDLSKLPVGARLCSGSVVLQITQIGKNCHQGCAIYQQVGDCIMPREGVFAEVISGGFLTVGDHFRVELPAPDVPWTAAVITLSDRASRGEREDKSGPLAKEILEAQKFQVVESLILPDEPEQLQEELIRLSDRRQVSLIVTTGGTGFSSRDHTPEATMAIATRNAPGIAEAIRIESLKITPKAMLSRGVSVIRNQTLIVNLPGSPKAVQESLDVIMSTLSHGIEILRGAVQECGRNV
jgi:molybdopterin adenylyltransferase